MANVARTAQSAVAQPRTARIYEQAFFGGQIIPFSEASVSVGSSAVLYGLSVYTVFHVAKTADGGWQAFRLPEHLRRLEDSAKIIGLEPPAGKWDYDRLLAAVKQLLQANRLDSDVFVRASLHATALVPGTRSRGIETVLSMFIYEAVPIVPPSGARLKTSLWRRIPDIAIPSRAKVNGAYVNSVLARQDALDSGYDDCIFLDSAGHICELSAANIFMVRRGVLYTPDTFTDLLEGITRLSVIELARDHGIKVVERSIDLTELYIADEVFVSGTSAFICPVVEIDARRIGRSDAAGPITEKLRQLHEQALHGQAKDYGQWLTKVG